MDITTTDWATNVTSAERSRVESPYGFHAVAVQTGTGVNAGLVLGEEDMTLDVDTIRQSVEKTGRCVITHEATRFSGFGAALSQISHNLFPVAASQVSFFE